MEKKEYIQQEILNLVQFSGFLVFLAGVFVVLALAILDYFVTPENFDKFLIYRIITSFLFLLLAFLIKLKKEKIFQFIICLSAVLIVAGMVELMILSFGGHQSPYYVGMILVLFFLGIVPLPFLSWLFCLLLVYLIYFFPIIFFDEITNLRIFINNNIFLIFSLGACAIWRYFDSQLLIKKLSLEYDLAQEKEQLKIYSQNLEVLVDERTKELQEKAKQLQERVEELEKFQKITIGRELKMIELKKEIEKLKEELKKFKKI